ncbi:MAG: segregation/condensation protein A [bacterium]|nr:segregation/condensation protein A [bacterium]
MVASNLMAQIDANSVPYGVKLELFEGPLDLMLFLIRKDEIDVYDIPIADITRQFLAYVEIIQGLNLELAGDFVVMAATLMRIKSRMLLPSDPDAPDEEGDPREELVRRLLEYQQFKDVAGWLEDQQETFRDVYYRGASVDLNDLREEDEGEGFRPVGMFELLAAFKRAMDTVPRDTVHEVSEAEVTSEDRMNFVLSILSERGQVPFFELVAGAQRIVVVVTFVVVLELMKELKVVIKQADSDGEIWVYLCKSQPESPDRDTTS